MELLLKNSHNAGYVTNDVVYIAEDGHEWGAGELDTSVFTIVKNVTLTASEKELLLMPDEQLKFSKSALKVHSLLKTLIGHDNMARVGRRRYSYNNQLVRK